MKVLILSKALLVETYRRKLEFIARDPDVALVAVVPPSWREPRVGRLFLEPTRSSSYRLRVRSIALNGHFHLYFWVGLGRLLREERPDVLHIDEESFNLSTWQAMRLGARLGARCLFFNWANLDRRLPPPFSWFERYNMAHAAAAVAGNQEAAAILRRRGYQGPLEVIPQFGVDEVLFALSPSPPTPAREGFTVGYAGRLVPQKGVMDLLEALAGLPERVRLLLVGSGVLEPELRRRAEELGLGQRVEITSRASATEMPALYQKLDVLVLPSRTWPNWKEQFGRALIEAMACGVPVIGSNSGEIPHVIGDAGLVFSEGDAAALREQIRALLDDPARRRELAQRGRQRVIEHYTQEKVGEAYLALYRRMGKQ